MASTNNLPLAPTPPPSPSNFQPTFIAARLSGPQQAHSCSVTTPINHPCYNSPDSALKISIYSIT